MSKTSKASFARGLGSRVPEPANPAVNSWPFSALSALRHCSSSAFGLALRSTGSLRKAARNI